MAFYDLSSVRRVLKREDVKQRSDGLWRWAEVLPVQNWANVVTLGEGDSPLLPAPRLGKALGLKHLFIKDESGQPTGTFKARGLAVAVSKAKELGVKDFVIPTAGNAGGALSAYAQKYVPLAQIFN